VIYYDFLKMFQGVICPVLESSGGKKFIFIGWGVMCSNPHRLGGEVDFFHLINTRKNLTPMGTQCLKESKSMRKASAEFVASFYPDLIPLH
jgi:hypothetical protein